MVSWIPAGPSSTGLQPLVGSTAGLAEAWSMWQGHHPDAHLPTYLCSCGTGSQGWSPLMTPRFTASSTAHQFKWVEVERKLGHSTTTWSKGAISVLWFHEEQPSQEETLCHFCLRRIALSFFVLAWCSFFFLSLSLLYYSFTTNFNFSVLVTKQNVQCPLRVWQGRSETCPDGNFFRGSRFTLRGSSPWAGVYFVGVVSRGC